MLRAGAVAAACLATGFGSAGCELLSSGPDPQPTPDPLAPLLAGTVELIGRYDAALAAHPDLATTLTPIREAHVAHATELGRVIGTPVPTGTASAAPPTNAVADPRGTLAALRAAEQGARRTAVEACLAAPAERAALLGSIAAARASHPEGLR